MQGATDLGGSDGGTQERNRRKNRREEGLALLGLLQSADAVEDDGINTTSSATEVFCFSSLFRSIDGKENGKARTS